MSKIVRKGEGVDAVEFRLYGGRIWWAKPIMRAIRPAREIDAERCGTTLSALHQELTEGGE